MKKLTSILLAGVTALVMSGCDDNDPVADSVLLTDLTLGYKVTGTGIIDESGVSSITFCNGETYTVYTEYSPNTGEFYIEGDGLFMDDIYTWIYTGDFGTPGSLEVGVEYSGSYVPENIWTITSIEEVECTPNPV